MSSKNPTYMKEDRGRYYYRRRVPQKHQKALGFEVWNRPCGNVSRWEAVAMVLDWAKKDDTVIRLLADPEFTGIVREETELRKMAPAVSGLVNAQKIGVLPADFDPLEAARMGIKSAETNLDFDEQDRLARYRGILDVSFGGHITPPDDPDRRDEFDLVKRKLERRIAEIAGNPNTISAVAERYFDFAGVTPQVRNKYRRNIGTLIQHVGDVPLSHLSASQLRGFREKQSINMLPTSLASLFTPIRGMFNYAVENEIVELSPMASVQMPKDKRSIQMRKWKPFTPEESLRIFQAMDERWGRPMRGLSDQRRLAIHMVVRVQAFTCMRPKEVVTLRPENVTDDWIEVIGSKTEGSDRIIPLHPEIADFPAFFHAGGFDTFKTQKKDRVQTVRHNFSMLLRKYMDQPILDERKVLYSWRSTFSNAMRRAGADGEMRRAILGHAEAGALKHYNDGPEFAKKRKWIRASDPRTIHEEPGEDDDLD